MGFRSGLLIGLVLGGACAVLMAPARGEDTRARVRSALSSEEEAKADAFAAPLRKAMKAVREQAQQAWEEAHGAAREAEEEMRARYRASVSRRGRSEGDAEELRRRIRQR